MEEKEICVIIAIPLLKIMLTAARIYFLQFRNEKSVPSEARLKT